jgi:hypothetical protein
LKEPLKTLREKRQDAEREAEKKKQSMKYPTKDELRAEAEEPAPEIVLTISDESGAPIRRITGPITAGMHRVNWDLRYAPPALVFTEVSEGDEDYGPSRITGPLVLPGKYTVSLAQKVNGVTTELAGPVSFNVRTEPEQVLSPQDRQAQFEFHRRVAGLYRALAGALGASDEVKTRLRDIRRALRETTASNAQLFATADQIEKHLDGILRVMRGDEVLRKREENTPMSIADRVESIMDEERFSDAKPTQTHVETFNVASQQFTQQLAALRQLIDTDLVNLEKQMEAAGAPWTPGRLPDWKPEK